MNYYERHLGDYAKDTAHLTMIEHGAYGLLLDRYYSTEQGIPADQAHRLARARSKEERAAVDAVLGEFFTLVDGLWINARSEEEITKAQSKIKAAKENGKRGGRPKKEPDQAQQKPIGLSVGSETGTQEKAHQSPDTSHQYQEDKDPPAARVPPAAAGPRPAKKCPATFDLTAEQRQWAASEAPGIDIDRETAKFRDHTFATARSDWPGSWRNWIRKAFDDLKPAAQRAAPAESFRERDQRLAAERVREATGGLCHDRKATGEKPRELLPFERGYVAPSNTNTIEGEAREPRRITA